MYTPKLEKDIRCPLEYGLEVFGGKWKSRIICVLGQQQVLRYSALKKEMVNITDAVLAAALKELIADGIVAAAREIAEATNIKAIATFSQSGTTASLVSPNACTGFVSPSRRAPAGISTTRPRCE